MSLVVTVRIKIIQNLHYFHIFKQTKFETKLYLGVFSIAVQSIFKFILKTIITEMSINIKYQMDTYNCAWTKNNSTFSSIPHFFFTKLQLKINDIFHFLFAGHAIFSPFLFLLFIAWMLLFRGYRKKYYSVYCRVPSTSTKWSKHKTVKK